MQKKGIASNSAPCGALGVNKIAHAGSPDRRTTVISSSLTPFALNNRFMMYDQFGRNVAPYYNVYVGGKPVETFEYTDRKLDYLLTFCMYDINGRMNCIGPSRF